jgi:hypothetical protein
MRQKSGREKQPAEDVIRDIRRATRRRFSAEEKIRVVLEGLGGDPQEDGSRWLSPAAAWCRENDRFEHVYPGERVLLVNWPPFRADIRRNLEGLRLSSSTGLCLTIISALN